MITLMQCRMDRVMPVPDTQSRPVVQTPTPRDDQTPLRRCRTPVRRPRGMDESRSSTRSRSPIRRSSSSESSPRDASPVDFSPGLDTAENVKDKSLSDEEDDEGSQRKVSAVQYQLFRQAVTWGLIRLTQPSLAGLPGRLFWIWVKLKWQTEYHGWTSRH